MRWRRVVSMSRDLGFKSNMDMTYSTRKLCSIAETWDPSASLDVSFGTVGKIGVLDRFTGDALRIAAAAKMAW
jgi:hypothetical protein